MNEGGVGELGALLELNRVEDGGLGTSAPRHRNRFASTRESSSVTGGGAITDVVATLFIFASFLKKTLLASQSLLLFAAKQE
jgi:hypothetical protein